MKFYPLAVLALTFFAGTLQAMEVLGGVSGRYERTDNVALAELDEQDEDMLSGRIDLTMVEESGRVRGSTTLYAERVDYRENLVADETRYNLATVWSADVIENRLLWVLEDVASRRRLDARSVDIASNRIDQNVLNTGPDLNFSAGPRDQLVLSARYGNAWYGDSVGVDNERYTGSARLAHQLSSISTATLGYTRTRTHFLDSTLLDYEREESSLLLSRNLTRAQFSLEAGYNRVISEDNEQYDGTLGEISWRQQWRQSVYTRLFASTDITDTAQEVIANAIDGGVDIDLTTASDVYRRKVLGATGGWTRATFRGDFGVRLEEQEYRKQPLDQKLFAADAGVVRALTDRSDLVVTGYIGRYEYYQSDRIDTEVEAEVRYNYVFSNRFFGAIGATLESRDSSIPLGDYVAHTVFIEFGLRQSLLARERGRELRHQGQAVY